MDLLPILSKAESYSIDNPPKKMKPSPKKVPYKGDVARKRVLPMISSIIEGSRKLDKDTICDGSIVTKLILHPSFLAKSYYPKDILNRYDLKNIGSMEVWIQPEERVVEKQKKSEYIVSSQMFISGLPQSFENLLDDIKNSNVQDVEDDLQFATAAEAYPLVAILDRAALRQAAPDVFLRY